MNNQEHNTEIADQKERQKAEALQATRRFIAIASCFRHNEQPAMRSPSRSAQAIRNDPDRAKTEHDLSRMEQARIKRERKGARL